MQIDWNGSYDAYQQHVDISIETTGVLPNDYIDNKPGMTVCVM